MTSSRAVEVVVSLLLLVLAGLLAFDNWRTGMGWDSTGPQAGYFPFYLSMILAAASLYGLAREFVSRKQASDPFVTREQFWRVLQVFLPTLAFCLLTQWLGLYVASLLLVARFMAWGRPNPLLESLVTAARFTPLRFLTL